ncbi:MAG: tRNA (guanosine(37)-N1)-methyltransferase TrmD [Pseudomonadota bacterium]
MSFQAHVLTLYPAMFPGPLGQALAGRALDEGVWALEVINIRDYATDKHRTVDGTPAGGGPGMVMRADVLAAALDSAQSPGPRWLMSPRGRPFTQAMARALVAAGGVTLVCGRFEGVDERVIQARGLTEISLADAVLSGGEIPALAVLDAVVRLLPGVMGNTASAQEESFADGLLEHPQYTRPAEFEGRKIPEVLLSGDHAKVAAWRKAAREQLTADRRPDLWHARKS